MKKLMMAAVAASILCAPAIAAAEPQVAISIERAFNCPLGDIRYDTTGPGTFQPAAGGGEVRLPGNFFDSASTSSVPLFFELDTTGCNAPANFTVTGENGGLRAQENFSDPNFQLSVGYALTTTIETDQGPLTQNILTVPNNVLPAAPRSGSLISEPGIIPTSFAFKLQFNSNVAPLRPGVEYREVLRVNVAPTI